MRSRILLLACFSFVSVEAFASNIPPKCGEEGLVDVGVEKNGLISKIEALWSFLSQIKPEETTSLVNGRFVNRGLPQTHEVIRLSETETSQRTFRHYTSTEGLEQILASKTLIVGKTAYVDFQSIFTDVRGVFLTDPQAESGAVGLHADNVSWIDIKVDPKIPVIKLSRFPIIYVIPGVGTPPEWMKAAYQGQNKNNKSSSTEPYRIFDWQATEVPVQIVGVSPHPYHDYSQHNAKDILSRRDSQSGWDLLGFLMQEPKLKALYQESLGENIPSVLSHTGGGLQNFLRQFPFFESRFSHLESDIRIYETLKLALALHDIGKGRAIKAGDKDKQHEFTLPILRQVMTQFNFNEAEIRLAETLVGNDVIGETFNPRINLSVETALLKLQDLAVKAEVSPSNFIELQLFFYTVDAGSYSALRAELFVENEQGRLLPKSPKYKSLRNLAGLPDFTAP